MRNNHGFTIWEVMTVIAIIGIIATFAVPGLLAPRGRAKVQGSANNLRGDINWAKMMAAREGAMVVLRFDSDSYQIFVDNNADSAPTNWVLGPEDRQLRTRQMSAGVAMDASDLPDNVMRFNRRGLPENLGPDNLGTIGLAGISDSRQIQINMVGLIDVQ